MHNVEFDDRMDRGGMTPIERVVMLIAASFLYNRFEGNGLAFFGKPGEAGSLVVYTAHCCSICTVRVMIRN